MGFDGSFATGRLAFGHEDDTVNSKAETLRELKMMLRGVNDGILNESFFHGSVVEPGRTFRSGKHAPAGQRPFDSGGANGPGLSFGGVSCQPSPSHRLHGFAGGQDRTPLERAFAGWYFDGPEKGCDSSSRMIAVLRCERLSASVNLVFRMDHGCSN